ncbi:S-adenosylmethionine sensor upstream of mTORC1 [Chironomus tepperi]|uniref:S-adenosylmethionine sensor upstream of mTORC1 n=1 Tax=Chironomus tepperi TaxID=113505 RepID=UPI00391F098B
MDNLEEQKKLANIIKGIHQDLRKSSKEVGADEAWTKHLKNKEKLDLYAKTMKELSETHWKQKNTDNLNDRIKWIISYSEFYFQQNELESFRQKDLNVIEKLRQDNQVDINDYKKSIEINEKLKVLDVGSNGNFFKIHERFDLTPIDIAPSSDDCFYCDFYSVPISQELVQDNQRITNLPENHFDIVTFCLLLEYLPTSEMRIRCCENAYKVLKTEGILIIITPDSSSQHRNAAQIKNWRFTLAMLGFRRIKVEKLKNLTCMVFRKSLSKDISKKWAEKYKEPYMDFKLEIPQDRKIENEETQDESDSIQYTYEPEIMNELPVDFD